MTHHFVQAFIYGLVILSLTGNAYAGKIRVCHKDSTLWINEHALQAHKNHGDVRGRCEDFKRVPAIVIFRCGLSLENGMVVTAVSSTVDLPVALPQIVETDNCADANAALMEHDFTLKNVTSGPVDADFETEYLYETRILQRWR